MLGASVLVGGAGLNGRYNNPASTNADHTVADFAANVDDDGVGVDVDKVFYRIRSNEMLDGLETIHACNRIRRTSEVLCWCYLEVASTFKHSSSS
jgi:hypothetical protein